MDAFLALLAAEESFSKTGLLLLILANLNAGNQEKCFDLFNLYKTLPHDLKPFAFWVDPSINGEIYTASIPYIHLILESIVCKKLKNLNMFNTVIYTKLKLNAFREHIKPYLDIKNFNYLYFYPHRIAQTFSSTLSKRQLNLLGQENLLLWVVFSMLNDVFDNSSSRDKVYLSTYLLSKVQLEKFKLVPQILLSSHLYSNNFSTKHMVNRSLGFFIVPQYILLKLGLGKTPIYSLLQRFFIIYTYTRQFLDDIRDWVEDINNAKPTYVTRYLLKIQPPERVEHLWRFLLPKLLGELKVQISKSYVYLADLHKLGVKTQFYKEMLHAQEFLLDEMTLERKTVLSHIDAQDT
jgi:hypothetical protein